MKISILTLFPDTISTFISESIIKRAQDKGAVEIHIINIRDFAVDSYGSVDDKPYGGGFGMVLRVDVVSKALQHAAVNSHSPAKIILTSPRGDKIDQNRIEQYALLDHLIIICGHYEGIDERVSEIADESVSLGDFVMTGGEIPAAALVDAVVRLLPGVIKKDSSEQESFSEVSVSDLKNIIGEDEYISKLVKNGVDKVRLLEFPQYTRPEEFEGNRVPKILLSGNHKEIEKWRIQTAYEETKKKRPDLLISRIRPKLND